MKLDIGKVYYHKANNMAIVIIDFNLCMGKVCDYYEDIIGEYYNEVTGEFVRKGFDIDVLKETNEKDIKE